MITDPQGAGHPCTLPVPVRTDMQNIRQAKAIAAKKATRTITIIPATSAKRAITLIQQVVATAAKQDTRTIITVAVTNAVKGIIPTRRVLVTAAHRVITIIMMMPATPGSLQPGRQPCTGQLIMMQRPVVRKAAITNAHSG